MADRTQIPLDSDTRDALRGMKQGAETYDDVLNRLIRRYKVSKTADQATTTNA